MEQKEPQVKISDPRLDAIKVFDEKVGDIQKVLQSGIKAFNWLITFVVGVMFLGFLTLSFTVINSVVDSWQVYEESKHKQVQEDIIKNNVEQQTILIKKIENLQKGIEALQIPAK